MTCESIRAILAARLPHLARVEVFDTLPSTNTYARALAEAGCPDGTVVLARAQSAGRGRFDRRFHSPSDCGMYLSYVVRPTCSVADAPYLTTCAAVAVAEAVEQLTARSVGIKWVNDLWMGEKKICGILTEGVASETGGMRYAVIGIGLNVRACAFPPALADIATSLEGETGTAYNVADVTAAVLDSLIAHLAHFFDRTHLLGYRARSVLDGRRVTVSRGEELYEATVEGIGEAGELLLIRDNGERTALVSGEVVRVQYNI